jgi:TRAP-type C4-dicarboxylate transport system substrate-binding protein
MKKTLTHIALASAALLFGSAASAQVVLKVHHFLGPKSPAHVNLIGAWCADIAKASKDEMKCNIFPAMQLGGTPAQLFDQAKDGTADIVWTLPGYTANRFTKTEVFELPFMMRSAEATSGALYEFATTHAPDEFTGVKIIALHTHGPGVIHTKDKQVTKLEDLQGMKLRGPTRLTSKMLGYMGATAIPMPVPAVPEAFNKGVIQGTILPYEVVPAIKLNELAKFVAQPDPKGNALYTATFGFVMNQAKYDSLPPHLKKVIDDHSGLATSKKFGAILEQADAAGKKSMEESKVTISVIPASEIDRWETVTQKVTDDWIKEHRVRGMDGAFLLKEAKDMIQKHSK